MIKKLLYSVSLTVLLLSLVACSSNRKPILNLHNQSVPKSLTATQVKECIQLACTEKRWGMKEVKPGLIHAMIDVRQHSAEIAITYSKTGYSIDYYSSNNLKLKNGKIHRNYNKWITLLDYAIQEQMRFMLSNQTK